MPESLLENDNKNCVDIVLPSCNGARFIREQVHSIQANYRYAELVHKIIIVDDASDDNTLDILYHLSEDDARIQVESNPGARRGVKANVAFGLGKTTAPMIMLSDQDDVWHLHKLNSLVATLRRDLDEHGAEVPVLVFSNLEVVDCNLEVLDRSFWHYQRIRPEWAQTFGQLLCQNVAPGCSMIFNRSLVEKALPFPDAALMHDWWLILTAKAFGRVFWIEEALTMYRQHGANQVGAKRFGDVFVHGLCSCVKRTHTNLYRLSAQARAFYSVFGPADLSAHDLSVLEALQSLPSLPLSTRLALVLDGTIKKDMWLRNAGLLLVMCLPPCRNID